MSMEQWLNDTDWGKLKRMAGLHGRSGRFHTPAAVFSRKETQDVATENEAGWAQVSFSHYGKKEDLLPMLGIEPRIINPRLSRNTNYSIL